MSGLNGILPIDKPVGPTSHDIVAIARRALRTRRIGHTGTLDPFASGLLLLCLGPSTRLAEYLSAQPKCYTATLRLGIATDTDDLHGRPIRSSGAWVDLAESDVRDALARLAGSIKQVPPRYSAKKVAGERMYEAARRGEQVDLQPVDVTISRIELTGFAPPDASFEVDCSSGTYIRAIARDAGEFLGVGAHLTHLRRTCIGSHEVSDALTINHLNDPAVVEAAMLPPAAAVSHLPRVLIVEEQIETLRNGGAIPAPQEAPDVPPGEPIALLSTAGFLLAIGELKDGRIRPRKVFA